MRESSEAMVRWEDIAAPANVEMAARALATIESVDPLAVERHFQEKLRDLTDATKHVALYPILCFLASRFRPKRYLEVGVWRAYSTVTVASAWPAAEIVAMDNWSNPQAVTPEEARRRIEGCGHVGHLTLLSGDSQELVTPKLGAFDLILVDGGHLLEVMEADLANCAPLLTPGGHLVAHDVFAPHVPAREMVWRTFQKRHSGWQWFEHRPAPGVGIGRNTP